MHHVAAGKVECADNVTDKGAIAAPDHVGKRRIDHKQPNAQEGRHGPNLTRPARLPVTIAAVIMANAIWKAMLMIWG